MAIRPSKIDFVSLLKASAEKKDLNEGIRLHSDILKRGLLQKSLHIASSLISMYAKCGAFSKAHQVLDELHTQDVVSWNGLIAGYAMLEQGERALYCYQQLKHQGLFPSPATLISIFKASINTGAVEKGKQIHCQIVNEGLLERDTVLGNALLDMYARCCPIAQAQQVFDELSVRNVISWSALIAGYVKHGMFKEAWNHFEQMQCEGLSPNAITLTCILKACSSVGCLEKGRQLHNEIVTKGLLGSNAVIGNALVDMYAQCGKPSEAHGVLENLPQQDVVSWSALIRGYAQHGFADEALECYEQMQTEGFFPNVITFVCILRACVCEIEKGKAVHNEIARKGLLGADPMLETALVDMYGKHGAFEEAQQVLYKLQDRDVVSWTVLISGYVQQGRNEEALACFEKMKLEGHSPNAITFSCVLKACAGIGAVDMGKQIHDEIIRKGILLNDVVLGSLLVDMYTRCGMLAKAQHVFDSLSVRNIATWSVLISGYFQHGEGEEAIRCFEQMQHEGIYPNVSTYTSVLNACGISGSIEKGKKIHDEIVRNGLLGEDPFLRDALANMYIKCGALKRARKVMDEFSAMSFIGWTTLISGYAQQGQAMEALACFQTMQRQGFSPNAVTFLSVLRACCHAGLMDEGQMVFEEMKEKYGILPASEHYTCMIDLFGRAGQLDKAMSMIAKASCADYLPAWGALLAACRKWENVKLGRVVFEQAIHLDKSHTAAYLSMGSMYTAGGMHGEADKIEEMRKTIVGADSSHEYLHHHHQWWVDYD